jgi:hypothetical protein
VPFELSVPLPPNATLGTTRQAKIARAQRTNVRKVRRLGEGMMPAGPAVPHPEDPKRRKAPRLTSLPERACHPNFSSADTTTQPCPIQWVQAEKRRTTTQKNTFATFPGISSGRFFADWVAGVPQTSRATTVATRFANPLAMRMATCVAARNAAVRRRCGGLAAGRRPTEGQRASDRFLFPIEFLIEGSLPSP